MVTARFDLEMILGDFGPMVEVGLTNMPMGSADSDTSVTAAMFDMTRTIMASSLRLDLALRIEGETLTLHSGYAVTPGSPLDPGPQPSFEDALQLTRLLPAGGNIIQTMAMDQTRQFEVFKDYYLANMNKAVAGMPPEQGDAYLV